jgi:virginiamycin B lyase
MSSFVVRCASLACAVAGLWAIAGSADAAPRITEYSVAQPTLFPCTTAVDRSTGNIYFAAMLAPTSSSAGSIGVLDPATRAVRKIPLASPLASVGGMAFAPDGNVYFAEYGGGNAIGRLDPRTDTVVEFPLPTPLSQPSTLVLGPDDGIWFIENTTQRLGRFDPVTHEFTEYPLPSPGANVGLQMMNRGDGDDLLFGLPNTNQIGAFNVATKQFRTYTSPTPLSMPQGVAFAAGAIWFTETFGQKLARVDPVTGAITEFPLAKFDPLDLTQLVPFPSGMMTAADGNLYILNGTAMGGDSITRFDPVTHEQTNVRTPTVASGPCDFDVTSRDTIWFGEMTAGKIGRLQVTP